jgi:KamA family protein
MLQSVLNNNKKKDQLPDAIQQATINQQFNVLSERDNLLPIKVTPFFEKKVREEIAVLGHREGPLHRIVYPTQERLSVRAPAEVPDFVDDRTNMPEAAPSDIIQKYTNRMLFLPTSTCAAHCQYCFRQDVLSEEHGSESKTLAFKLANLETHIKNHPDIKEVILSGGDPMTLSFSVLKKIMDVLKNKLKIESIRIHTKTISYSPQAFKNDDKLKMLADANVRMVFHLCHPYEICDEVLKTIERIRAQGIRCYNQFPILRNINDHAEVLAKHLQRLDELGIRNLSVFIPDPINYSASFRINLKRLFKIIDTLNWSTNSWVNSTRFVLDTPVGKVRREDIKYYDEAEEVAIFEREGKQVRYPDFPAALDIPGDLNTLLWKEYAGIR